MVAEEAVMVRDEDLVARVVRSNLATSNGYIHIIDSVLMKVQAGIDRIFKSVFGQISS